MKIYLPLIFLILLSCRPEVTSQGSGIYSALKGGVETTDSQWNSIFYLEVDKGSYVEDGVSYNLKGRCVGTAISNQVLVTAAHCLFDKDESGHYQQTPPEKIRLFLKGAYSGIASVHIGENFNPAYPYTKNDYAFLVLNESIKSDSINYIPLLSSSERSQVDQGEGLQYFGYEEEQPNQLFTRVEQWRDLNNEKISVPYIIEKGDSGGPLVVTLESGEKRIAGIASYVNRFTRTAFYASSSLPSQVISRIKNGQEYLRTVDFDDHWVDSDWPEIEFSVDDFHLHLRRSMFESPRFNLFAKMGGESFRGYVYLSDLQSIEDLEGDYIVIPAELSFEENPTLDKIKGKFIINRLENRFELHLSNQILLWN